MAYSLFLGLAVVTLFSTINLVEADWKDDIKQYIEMLESGTCKTNLKKDIDDYTDDDDSCEDIHDKIKKLPKETSCTKVQIRFMSEIACQGDEWKARTINYVLSLNDGTCRAELFNNAQTVAAKDQDDACDWAKKNVKKSFVKDTTATDTKSACSKNVNERFKDSVCGGAGMMVLGTLTALACFLIHLFNKF